ncbi:MAG: hypothetical protein KF850_04435 [Labilithrix sp.]|nr:hypothetical protein [Labilithrix sp.]
MKKRGYVRRSAVLRAMCGFAALTTALACATLPGKKKTIPPDIAAIGVALGSDFSGNSVRITGVRTPPAGGAHRCVSDIVTCLNFNDDNTTEAIVGLCPSEDDPSGTWTFTYEIFAGLDCAPPQLADLECAATIDEVLPAGVLSTNYVLCSSDTSGVGFRFTCADGSVCIPPTVTFSGDAYGVQTSAGLNVGVGPLSPDGGLLTTSVANVTIAGLGTINAINATTQGAGLVAQSNATASGLTLSVVGLATITATTITGQTRAQCPPAVDGGAIISNLIVAPPLLPPIVITPSGAPNQVVVGLPVGLSIILNEQVITIDGGLADIDVVAVRITVLGTTIRLGRAHSDVTCSP